MRANAIANAPPPPARDASVMADLRPSDVPEIDLGRFTLPLVSCGRFSVRVHASLLLYTVGSVLLTLSHPQREPVLIALAVHGPVLWVSVLLHELAKVLPALLLRVPLTRIILWPFGGLTLFAPSSKPKHDIVIAVAGVLMNVCLALLVFGAISSLGYGELRAQQRAAEAAGGSSPDARGGKSRFDTDPLELDPTSPLDRIVSGCLYGALWINSALAVANTAAPAFPLDSARVFVNAQILMGSSAADAANLLVFISMPCVPALIVYGLYSIGNSGEVAVLTCALAIWTAIQARLVLYCRQLEILEQHPLFAHLPHQVGAHPTHSAHNPLVLPDPPGTTAADVEATPTDGAAAGSAREPVSPTVAPPPLAGDSAGAASAGRSRSSELTTSTQDTQRAVQHEQITLSVRQA
jgi:hypothetical protein